MLSLTDAHDLILHGGKAVALAALARAGLPVPPGIVLDCAQVAHISGGGAVQVGEQLAAWAHAIAPYGLIVRSSAPAEDGHSSSFAGLFTSRFVRGVGGEEILQAVTEVHASVTSPAVISYATARGLPAPTGVAALIQPALRPRSAGVLFTRWGPGWRIEATLGLASLLVNGDIAPDIYQQHEQRIAEKYVVALPATPGELNLMPGEWTSWPGGRSKVVFSADGLTYIRPSATTGHAAALDPNEVEAVRELGQRAAAVLGREALDVEWASDGERLWLLQARPATVTTPSPTTPASPTGHVLVGEAASSGSASGQAVVIMQASDSARMPEGGILICGPARPELVPALVRAGGIGAADAGLLCHTAIVARELGKPCVTGLTTAPDTVSNGDLVTIDGDRGWLVFDEHPVEQAAPPPRRRPRGLRVVTELSAATEPCVLAVDHLALSALLDDHHEVLAGHGVVGLLLPADESSTRVNQRSTLIEGGGQVLWLADPPQPSTDVWAGDPAGFTTRRSLESR